VVLSASILSPPTQCIDVFQQSVEQLYDLLATHHFVEPLELSGESLDLLDRRADLLS